MAASVHRLQKPEEFAAVLPIDDRFPEKQASLLSAREAFNKHLFRPNTYLHKWWARRSGTCFRHILKSLVTDPEKQDFYSPGGLEDRIVLDPMMGGGTTLHEALRLGARVIGIDIDPIPVVQARAALADIPLWQKEGEFDAFFKALRSKLSQLYLTTCPICSEPVEFRFVLYGYRKHCRCGDVVVVDSLVVRENPVGPPVSLCPGCGGVKTDDCCSRTDRHVRLVPKDLTHCPICHEPFVEYVELPYRDRYEPLALNITCPHHGQLFKTPDHRDRALIAESPKQADSVRLSPRYYAIPIGPKSSDLRKHGVHFYWELFTGRQLLYIKTSAELLRGMAPELRDVLGMLVSTSLDFNSLLCGYKGAGVRRPGAVRHVFAHHAYSIPYIALENNPITTEASSGSLLRLFRDRIWRGANWARNPREVRLNGSKPETVPIPGETDSGNLCTTYDELSETAKGMLPIQGDSRQMPLPDAAVDFVVTDPPYFDNVQYTDLSRFFRVWLNYLLPRRAKWGYSPGLSAVAGDNRTTGDGYTEMMAGIWRECRRVLRSEGRLIFTFHHWRPEAWIALTLSLKSARARLVNCYVVEAENPSSVHIIGLKALKHDCILVFSFDHEHAGRRIWRSLSRIATTDSEQFCRDCGETLGWLLDRDDGESGVISRWQGLLGVSATPASSLGDTIPNVRHSGSCPQSQSFRQELFDKLYDFFHRYFSPSGSIYFQHTPAHKNIYEKVYTDDRDVVLFWKTHMLYYVKTDRRFYNSDNPHCLTREEARVTGGK
jgi:putative DNA methylase